jgi:sugar/nucleoside kinase (ribokinase family)
METKHLEMHPKYVVAGPLQREFVILHDGSNRLDFLGGSGVVAAAGLGLWDGPVGLLCRVGEDYPREWLEQFEKYNLDSHGVKIQKEVIDLRSFYGYRDSETFETGSPVGYFARHKLPFPPVMLNYKSPTDAKDDLSALLPTSPRANDIPAEYLDATAIHLCPMDFMTQSLLQPALRSGATKTITAEAYSGYMLPEYWLKLPSIVSGLTGFIVKENDLRLFFRNRSNDLLEMAETVAKMGCEIVVIHLTDGNKVLVEYATHKKWLIPAYPVDRKNRHNSSSAFGGGLLAGYQQDYDPLNAALHGEISESMAAEGLHPFYLFDALPGLAEARLEVLREMIKPL